MGNILIRGLGKAYKQYGNRWDRLIEWMSLVPTIRHSHKWILKDVNLDINAGDAVGIVGKNGAGKSTLLKMITGTTEPTEGHIQIQGRVAALLELGMGFDPDFTGRQNVFMAGQLQGLNINEINNLMPEIEAFADIGSYIEEPLRTYSSGMQARLAFSVATCVKPDILIVDEALSVGDIAFQAKCMQRMEFLLKSGTTIIFVSHALNQIRQFCNKAIYIKDGRVELFGDVSTVCDQFQNDLLGINQISEPAEQSASGNIDLIDGLSIIEDPMLRKNSVLDAAGTMDLQFMSFKVFDEKGNEVSSCTRNQKLIFIACIRANRSTPSGANVGLLFADKNGYHLMACNTNYYDIYLPEMNAGETIFVKWTIEIPFALGEFRLDIGIKPEPYSTVFYDRVFCVRTLVANADVNLLKKNFGGYLFVDACIEVKKQLESANEY
jgi:ABC-type polysaccharide/polyol phosphate transport system, ATPase component